MAKLNSHIILKQILDLRLPNRGDPFQHQKELAELAKNKLEPALSSLFDKYAGPDEIIQIGHLEVDIGKKAWIGNGDALVEAVIRAIEKQLEAQINNGSGQVTRKPIQAALFEAWNYFLENGYFPNNTVKTKEQDLLSSLLKILEKEASFRVLLIRSFKAQPRKVERLIKQYPEAFLLKLFAILTGNSNSRIDAFIQEIQRLTHAVTSTTHPRTLSLSSQSPETCWKWVFGNLKPDIDLKIEEKKIIRAMLKSWIHHQKSNFNGGESSLRHTLMGILQASPGNFPLLVKLRDQLAYEDLTIKGQPVINPDSSKKIEDTEEKKDLDSGADGTHYKEKSTLSPNKTNSRPLEKNQSEAPNKSGKDSTEQVSKEEKTIPSKEALQEVSEPLGHLKRKGDISNATTAEKDTTAQDETSAVSKKTATEIPEQKGVKDFSKTGIVQKKGIDDTGFEHKEGEFWYISHAGIVLLHTFLPVYFQKCGLVENKAFKDPASQERAVQLILYLASGETSTPENDLVLPKFLCGVPFNVPIDRQIILKETEKTESIKVLQAAIDHWGKLKKTSPDGLREGFLQREGKLEKRQQGWYLIVEQKSMDILLNYLPWNLRMVKLPWMEGILHVEWG
jgi:hypothetical protein